MRARLVVSLLSLSLLSLAVASSLPAFKQQTPYERVRGSRYNVSYDHRAFTINGTCCALRVRFFHLQCACDVIIERTLNVVRLSAVKNVCSSALENVEKQHCIHELN